MLLARVIPSSSAPIQRISASIPNHFERRNRMSQFNESKQRFAKRESPQNELQDQRTSDQIFIDLAAARNIRATAECLDAQGEFVTAVLFRSVAEKMETGRNWLDDSDVLEVQR
jgi:hypothetical protein